MKKIDIETWHYKNMYQHFKMYQYPVFDRSIKVVVNNAYDYCKNNGYSFFIFSLYAFLKGFNEIPAFRYREIKGEVIDVEKIAVTTPIMPKNDVNHQFKAIDIPFLESFTTFHTYTQQLIDDLNNGIITQAPKHITDDMICLSCLPWFSYTSSYFGDADFMYNAPVLDWGKFTDEQGKKIMPYTVRANCMFVGPDDMGAYVDKIAFYFNNPHTL